MSLYSQMTFPPTSVPEGTECMIGGYCYVYYGGYWQEATDEPHH